MKEQLRHSFKEIFGHKPDELFFSPGRVNLIGEHIDYNGGLVLPAAISLGIWAAVRRRKDSKINVYAASYAEHCHLDADRVTDLSTIPAWGKYIAGMLAKASTRVKEVKGADIYLYSTLPIGAGLSSSAALECLTGMVFAEKYYRKHLLELALDAQQAEHEYAGVPCGIMDQYVIAFGKKNHAILLDCAELKHVYVDARMKKYSLVIINSNFPRSLAQSKYKERREECDRALEAIRAFTPAEDLCHANQLALAYLEDDLLYSRAKHAITEQLRVQVAVKYLEEGDMENFGFQLTSSHRSLSNDYEVSSPELDAIVHFATHHGACLGARMTGAGFGGCCIALVEKDGVKLFAEHVGRKYEHKTGIKADFYPVEIVAGVGRLE
jgi:galactokinase